MDVNYIENWYIESLKKSKSPITQSKLEIWQRLDKLNIIAMSDKEFEDILLDGFVCYEMDRILLRDKRRTLKNSRFFNDLPRWRKEEVLGLTSPQLKKRFGNDNKINVKNGELPLFKKEVVHYWGAEIWKNVKKFSVFESGTPNRSYTTLDQINLLQKQKDFEAEIDLNLINNISKTKGEEMAKRALNQSETKLSDLLIQKMAIDDLLKAHKDFISNDEFSQRIIAILEEFDKIKRGSAPLFCPIGNTKELYLEKTREGALERLSRIYDPFSIRIPNFADRVTATLIKKGQEYTKFDNRISNFVDGANKEWFKISKKDYLFALAMKHLQYLIDNKSSKEVDDYYIEHAQDLFNYMLIYVACFDKFAS